VLVFFHVLTNETRISDPDGHECVDLKEACGEASQIAREVIANELQAGRPVPLKWRIEVALADGTSLATINFAEVALGVPRYPPPRLLAATTEELIGCANAIMAEAQEREVAVRAALGEAQAGLRMLAQLNASLGRKMK
jgi:hypothetical protein